MNTVTYYERTQPTEPLPLRDKDAILETLYELGLPEETYVVIGGASMVLRGIKTHTEDLDMLVSEGSMRALAETPGASIKNPPLRARYRGATNNTVWVKNQFTPIPVSATDELGDGYYPMSFDGIKDRAEMVSFVPCLPLEDVVKSKEALQRPKDIADLQAIAAFTGRALQLPPPKFTPPYEWS